MMIWAGIEELFQAHDVVANLHLEVNYTVVVNLTLCGGDVFPLKILKDIAKPGVRNE